MFPVDIAYLTITSMVLIMATAKAFRWQPHEGKWLLCLSLVLMTAAPILQGITNTITVIDMLGTTTRSYLLTTARAASLLSCVSLLGFVFVGQSKKQHAEVARFFSLNGRYNRARFFWASMVVFGTTNVLGAAIVLVALRSGVTPYFARVFAAPIAVAGVAALIPPTVKRLHDLNRSGTVCWLLVVPLLSLYVEAILLLRRGTRGTNIYGADPSEKEQPVPDASCNE